MRRPFVLLAAVGLAMCQYNSSPREPELGAIGKQDAKRSGAAADAGAAAADTRAKDERSARKEETRKRLEQARARLELGRALARDYASGDVAALGAERALLVDAKAPADTSQVQYFLFRGAVETPENLRALEERRGEDDEPARKHLLGGLDASRPAAFTEIEPGTFTACTILGPPRDPETVAMLERAAAEHRAEHGEKLDAKALLATREKLAADPNFKPQKIDWSALPIRCKTADISDLSESRVIVTADAAADADAKPPADAHGG